MKKLIFTWSPPSERCDWQLLDANGNREGVPQRGKTLAELQAVATGCELVWLAPGQNLLSMSASLPVKGRDKLIRALPYALEERLAEEPESLFFALPGDGAGPGTQTIATNNIWLRSALDTLAELGLSPMRVLPDYLALPHADGAWTVLADAGMLYVRTGAAGGFTLERDSGWFVLERRLAALPDDKRPSVLRYISGREASDSPPAIENLRPDPEPTPEGLFGIVAQGLATPASINLLQGAFKRGSEWRHAVKPWLPAAWACAAVVVLAIVGFSASWVHDAQAEQRLDKLVRQRYQQLLPNQPWFGIATARRLIRDRLSGASGSGADDLLSLLSAIAVADNGSVNIESLDYQGGRLQIRLHAPDVASLETLRTAIAERSRLTVTIQSANQTDAGVEGALSVGTGAGR